MNIDNLTLDDIIDEDFLKPSTLKKTRCLPLKNEKEERVYLASGEIPEVPWTPVALVLEIHEVHCTGCGSEWETPGSSGIMVRFQHDRKDETWTTTRVAGKYPSDLPRLIETKESFVAVCRHCFDQQLDTNKEPTHDQDHL